MAITVTPIADRTSTQNAADTIINLFNAFDDPKTTGLVAQFTLADNLGSTFLAEAVTNVLLFDQTEGGAPGTVQNFQTYVEDGDYTNSFIHRSVPGFVVQGGGFRGQDSSLGDVPTDNPIQNEFSSDRSNLRGTIAMAKLGNNPNSATSQWFFNLRDNSGNLDGQNGGFTVFGQVLSQTDLDVIDAIAALPIVDASELNSAFGNLPFISDDNTLDKLDEFVRYSNISITQQNELSFEVVSNSNSTVVSTTISADGQLALDYQQPGSAEIVIRATNLLGETTEDTFVITVNPATSDLNPVTPNPVTPNPVTPNPVTPNPVTPNPDPIDPAPVEPPVDVTPGDGNSGGSGEPTNGGNPMQPPDSDDSPNSDNPGSNPSDSNPSDSNPPDSNPPASEPPIEPGPVLLMGNDNADILSGDEGDNIIDGGGGNDRLLGLDGNDQLIGGGGSDRLVGGNGNDDLNGGGGKDNLNGGNGNDDLNGGGGNDKLNGGNGNDDLIGGGGNDTLRGGKGNDTLDGGPGSDRLIGGSGKDRFVLRTGKGQDQIRDFTNGQDKFRTIGFSFNDITLTQRGQNSLIRVGNKNIALVLKTDITEITAADFTG
ncbi:MAG: peptidylprolyl isomerase [Leptolyngbyaceae cyanobacterium]